MKGPLPIETLYDLCCSISRGIPLAKSSKEHRLRINFFVKDFVLIFKLFNFSLDKLALRILTLPTVYKEQSDYKVWHQNFIKVVENYYGINTNASNSAKVSAKSSAVWQREVSLTDFIVIVLSISHDGGDDDENEQNIISCIKQCMDSDHSSYFRLKTSQSKQKADFASVLQKVRRVAQHKNYIKASNDACEIFLNEPLTLVNTLSKKLKKFNVLYTHMDVNNGMISGSFSPRMFVDGLRMIDCHIDDYDMEEDIVESFLNRGYKHIESTESFVCIIFDLISPWEKNVVELSGIQKKTLLMLIMRRNGKRK